MLFLCGYNRPGSEATLYVIVNYGSICNCMCLVWNFELPLPFNLRILLSVPRLTTLVMLLVKFLSLSYWYVLAMQVTILIGNSNSYDMYS